MKSIRLWFVNNAIKIILLLGLFLVVIYFLDKCQHDPSKIIVPDEVVLEKVHVKKLNDSMLFKQQEALLVSTRAELWKMQAALQRELVTKMNPTGTVSSVEYVDRIVYKEVSNTNDYTSKDSLRTFPYKFKHSNKYLDEWYTVHSSDSSTIDSLQITGRTHLAIVESGKWYQKKTINVGLTNENPYYIVDSLQSIVYRPKQRSQLSIGPVLLTNGKSTTGGVAVNVKKGIFSFSIGYKLL